MCLFVHRVCVMHQYVRIVVEVLVVSACSMLLLFATLCLQPSPPASRLQRVKRGTKCISLLLLAHILSASWHILGTSMQGLDQRTHLSLTTTLPTAVASTSTLSSQNMSYLQQIPSSGREQESSGPSVIELWVCLESWTTSW